MSKRKIFPKTRRTEKLGRRRKVGRELRHTANPSLKRKRRNDHFYKRLDRLLPHKETIEKHLRQQLGELIEFKCDLLLYDITSTYFEDPAKRGHATLCFDVAISSLTPFLTHIDPWTILQNHRLAARRIQHPARNSDPEILFNLNDDNRFLLRP